MKKLLLLLLIALPVFVFSQKAYDAVYYNGTTQNVTLRFTLANGYLSASEIKTTDNKTKRTSKFLPETGVADEGKKMKFIHNSTSGKTFTDYFILEGMEDMYDKAPKDIHGKYYFNGTAYDLTLKKM